MIRSFAGGFELLISLLDSTDTKVLSCVCATVAEVAKNEENLAILTDLGVIDHLAKLVPLVCAFELKLEENNIRSRCLEAEMPKNFK